MIEGKTVQQTRTRSVTRAIKPWMPLCWLVLLAACTQAPADVHVTAADSDAGKSTTDTATTQPASTAGAGCVQADSSTQALICSNPALIRLDTELAQANATAHDTLDAAGQMKLQAEQQRWVQHTRDLCTDAMCLQQVYADRIAILSATRKALVDPPGCTIPAGQNTCLDMLTLRDPNSQLANFNQLLAQSEQNGTLLGCSVATNIPAGDNDLFAANCTLESTTGRSNVQVCSNQMVGQFALEPAAAAYGEQATSQLLAFTQQRCAG